MHFSIGKFAKKGMEYASKAGAFYGKHKTQIDKGFNALEKQDIPSTIEFLKSFNEVGEVSPTTPSTSEVQDFNELYARAYPNDAGESNSPRKPMDPLPTTPMN